MWVLESGEDRGERFKSRMRKSRSRVPHHRLNLRFEKRTFRQQRGLEHFFWPNEDIHALVAPIGNTIIPEKW